jgi:3-dehydroquinate synthase
MRAIEIHVQTGHSKILIGERLQTLRKYIRSRKAVIITDHHVRRYYGEDFPPCEVIEIGTGERIKNLDTVRAAYKRLVELETDRSSFIVGIGGGVVCDMTGFVASTFMRGVRFGFVASTLLSQVDASVGGKNGVNFMDYKNMVGVFNQPEFVICDMNLLKTLPEKEVLCGLAEIVKHAAISDHYLFSYLEKYYEKAVEVDAEVIEKLVHDSVLIKTSIVQSDEKESGERRKLNFGHTFGHAIEATTGISHGEAVSLGMMIASLISVRMGYLAEEDMRRLEVLLEKLKLPTRLSLDRKRVLNAIEKDKKRENQGIHFVLLQGIGNAVLEEMPLEKLDVLINEIEW